MSPSEHPVARLFPDMDRGEYSALVRDIETHGLKTPILLWRGQLIDGRHRLKACRKLGLEPKFETVDCQEADLPGLVWSLNGVRRQLTASQRAMVGDLLSEMSARGRPKAIAHEQKNTTDGGFSTTTQEQAARVTGVSSRHIQRAAVVRRQDQTLAHRVHKGEITVTAALKEIDRRQNPPKDPPPKNLPNLKYREWLDGAFKALESLEGYLRQITVYSRPPVPDEVGWAREAELKRQLTTLCAMIPKLCINEVGESWDRADSSRGQPDCPTTGLSFGN